MSRDTDMGNDGGDMKITMVGSRYCVKTELGRLHVLNQKSLEWNLKRVFGMKKSEIAGVVLVLNRVGVVTITAGAA
jgi:hypothetical protein